MTYSNGLTHITNSEASKGRIIGEGLNTHGLGRNHLDDRGIAGLDEFGVVLNGFTGTAVCRYVSNYDLTTNCLNSPIFSRSSENLQAMWAV